MDELDLKKLPILLKNKYQSVPDATRILGGVPNIQKMFVEIQAYLYAKAV